MTYLHQDLGATSTVIKPGVACRREGSTSRYGSPGSGQYLLCQGGKYVLKSGSAPATVYKEGQLRIRTDRRKDPPTSTESIYLGGRWVVLGPKKSIQYRHEGKTRWISAGGACRLGAISAGAPFTMVPECYKYASQLKGLAQRLSATWIKKFYEKQLGGNGALSPDAIAQEQAAAAKAEKTKRLLLYGGVAAVAVVVGLVATSKPKKKRRS